MNIPSKLLQKATDEFSKLPGIGKKTALRLVLSLLKMNKKDVNNFTSTINKLKFEIKNCISCHNISDSELCSICNNSNRDKSIICVVEDIRDIIAIEKTSEFNGIYHVLGGIISPIEGISPDELNIQTLLKKVQNNNIKEIIFALSTTLEGETTCLYIFKKINSFNIKMSVLARGISYGDELEYADEITLGRSIIDRKPFNEKN